MWLRGMPRAQNINVYVYICVGKKCDKLELPLKTLSSLLFEGLSKQIKISISIESLKWQLIYAFFLEFHKILWMAYGYIYIYGFGFVV